MIRIVRLSFHEQHRDSFLALFEERKSLIRNFPGCTYLELWQDKKDDCVFYTYSTWEDPQHLEDYRNSDLFGTTWTTVKAWFSEGAQAFSAEQLMNIP